LNNTLGRRAPLLLAILVLTGCFRLESARADSLTFSMDYGYSTSSSETTISETRNSDGTLKSSAATSQSSGDNFSQEYRLFFDKILYPSLVLRGGGSFTRIDSSGESDGVSSGVSTNIRKNPFLDLVLGSPVISASLGVNRYQDEARGSDGTRTFQTRDMYTASLGWRPLELPSFSLRTTHAESYDENRLTSNTVQDQLQFSSSYHPHRTTGLSYSANLDRNHNLLDDTEIRGMSQSGRVSYEDRFFRNLLNIASSYAVNQQSNEVISGAGGEFDIGVPFYNLKSYNESLSVLTPRQPLTSIPPNDPLFPVGAFPSTTISAPLVLPLTDPAIIEPLHIALDFGPEATTNVVRLYLPSDPSPDLPSGLSAASFTWKIFGVNANNEWQEISLQSVVYTSLYGERKFELRFPSQKAQYLKVVVTPLKFGNTPFNITTVETLYRQATATAGNKTTSLSQTYNLNLGSRIRLLENPGLDYNFSMFYRLSNPGNLYRLYVSNGSSLSHRLTPWLTGNVMFGRDDAMQTDQKDPDMAYRYGASFTAQPLPTLHSNLNYSGRTAQQSGTQLGSNSFSLNNRAALYPGLDLLLGGALTFASNATTKVQSESSQYNLGLSIAPHRTVSANLIGFLSSTSSQGGDRPDLTSSERRGQISVSYSPVSALSIFAAHDVVIRDEEIHTLQNYGMNWSPFRDGTLQVGLSYFETVQPESQALSRVFSPNLTWQIRRGTSLDLNYALSSSSTPLEETEIVTLSARLRVMF